VNSPASASLTKTSVGIGQLVVSKDPAELLVAYGLGSCVGLAVFDPGPGVGGLVHVLLPESPNGKQGGTEPGRHADTAVDHLLERLAAIGAVRHRLIVKLAGGASVLGPANATRFKIGERNAEAITARLKAHGLRPHATALGGTVGRTLELHLGSGKTYVRTATSQASEL